MIIREICGTRGVFSTVNYFLAKWSELFKAGIGDQIHVFYADASALGEKDFGFDGQRHARLKFRIASGG